MQSIYTDAESHFSLCIPSGWFADTSGQQGTRVILFKSSATAGFRANVNVLVHQLGAMTPDDYLALTRLQHKQMSGQPKMDIDQAATNHESGRILEWHAPMGAAHIKARQLIAFRGPLAFVVSATALYNNFAEYRQDFEAILDSFRFEGEEKG